MFDKALQIIAPHLCFGCGKIGSILCLSCKYDIVSEPYGGCIVCRRPSLNGICSKHHNYIDGAWMLGERNDVLERVTDEFKFRRAYGAHRDLADALSQVLPVLPENTIVTSVPTVRAHIRERGYDHAALLARRTARQANLPYRQLLVRSTSTKQRGASRKERLRQAKVAFSPRTKQMPPVILLIDDVVTTGATLHFAAKTLKAAGAKIVFIAAVAKQPLDQTNKI